jgi:hypothetical protein
MENEILNIFSKENKNDITLGELASQLGVDLDELQEMTLDDISALSIEKAEEETQRIQDALNKREKQLSNVEEKYNIDRRDMETGTRIWVEDLTKKLMKKKEINMNGLKELQKIAKLGKKEVQVELTKDIKITLRSLTAKEENEIFTECADLPTMSFINTNKVQTLARSIIEINGERYDAKESEEVVEFIKEKVKLIEQWGQNVIDVLFGKYADMVKDIEQSFEKLEIK